MTGVMWVVWFVVVALLCPAILLAMEIFSAVRSRKKLSSEKTPLEKQAAKGVAESESVTRVLKRVTGGGTSSRVHAKVYRMGKSVQALVPRLRDGSLGSQDFHTVTATATSYLPDAVDAYLALPSPGRDKTVVEDGKTALDLLCGQLDIMNRELEKVLVAASSMDATALRVHGRFLEEKYGPSSEMSLASTEPAATKVLGQIGMQADKIERSLDKVLPKPANKAPVPAGEYPVRVVDAEIHSTQNYDKTYRLTLEITEGPWKGRKLWKTLVPAVGTAGFKAYEKQMYALDLFDVTHSRMTPGYFIGRRAVARVSNDTWNERTISVVDTILPTRPIVRVEPLVAGPVQEGELPSEAVTYEHTACRCLDCESGLGFEVRDGAGRVVDRYSSWTAEYF